MASRAYSTGRAALRALDAGNIARPFAPIPNLRPWLESRVAQLLDEADRLIALLDTLDGDAEDTGEDLEPDADSEPDSDAEPSLGWSPGEATSGVYALAFDIDLEDEHDGGEGLI